MSPELGTGVRRVAAPLAVAALALALYAPTLRYQLQWDDASILVGGAALTGAHPFSDALTAPYLSAFTDSSHLRYYYRPASLLVLAAERAAFGAEPLGYRAI